MQNGTSRFGLSSQGSLAGLTMGSSNLTSAPSVASSIGVRNVSQRLLEDGVNVPSQGEVVYECPFDRLNCRLAFSNFGQWHSHSLTHFRGVEPPATNSCCFCEARFKHPDGKQSWRQRMEHVELHHRNHHRLGSSRFDMELYRYLWKHNILSDIDFKEVTGKRSGERSAAEQAYPSPATSPTSPTSGAFTVTESRHSNRRNRR